MVHEILDHGEVELINHAGGDESVLRSMLVSTGKDQQRFPLDSDQPCLHADVGEVCKDCEALKEEAKKNKGRINYLMRCKHGTPFEHNMFTFRIKAPIFVIREWHRHRIGWSYNEQSGRYMKLGEDYYVPKISDVRERVGKPGAYTYVPMEQFRASQYCTMLRRHCHESYKKYEQMLSWGIAPEQARAILHVNHYSSFYATCNARSLMNFCVLRNDEQAQQEIRAYAEILEDYLKGCMPITYRTFIANGRIAP